MQKEIIEILSSGLFKEIVTNKAIQIGQLNAMIALLIQAKIPFDLSFSPGDQRLAAQAELVIHINPVTTINFTIAFQPGGGLYT
ncbi:MAG: hypothetical protein PWP27_1663 [Clostridiales bacterium]|nr:hypothetical protein [Clostridiales bacterium]